MKNKKVLYTILGVVLAGALVVAGLFIFGPKTTPKPTNTPIATPTSEPTSVPEPTAATEMDASKELELAQKMYPDVHGTTSHSKEDVQLALLAGSGYVSSALSNSDFLSGKFVEDGYPTNRFEELYRDRFTTNAYASVTEAFQQINSGDETQKSVGVSRLIQLADIQAIGDTGYTMAESCFTDNTGCLVGDYPVINEINYDEEAATKRIIVTISTTSKPIYYTPEGVQQNLTNNYDWTFYMDKNDSEILDYNSGANTFAIDGFQVTVNRLGFTND